MKTSTQRLLTGLLITAAITSCSRPVAYFQQSPREHFATATAPTTPAPVVSETVPTPSSTEEAPMSSGVQLAQVNNTLDQMEASVRTTNKLATSKSVQKRLDRIRSMLATASVKSTLRPSATAAHHKSSLMERIMLKKMNKKINRQLAPQNQQKAMANTGVLAAGAVLVIVGLILLIVGSSTSVGVILLLAGAVVLLVGLL